MMPRESETHRLIAGSVCLDFANTLNGHGRATGHEYLHDFRDVALWSKHAGLVTPQEASLIVARIDQRPNAHRGLFRRTIRLREAIFRIFHAVAMGSEPPPEDLGLLNNAWRRGQQHACIVPSAGGFAVGWDDQPVLEQIPRSLAACAVDLLTSADVRRIRACAGEACDWLFIDDSRNHLRRWCSMDECGNRAKMRRRRKRARLVRVGKHGRKTGAPKATK